MGGKFYTHKISSSFFLESRGTFPQMHDAMLTRGWGHYGRSCQLHPLDLRRDLRQVLDKGLDLKTPTQALATHCLHSSFTAV